MAKTKKEKPLTFNSTQHGAIGIYAGKPSVDSGLYMLLPNPKLDFPTIERDGYKFAAARDLLQMLKDLFDAIDTGAIGPTWPEWAERIQDLIERAEGKSQS